MNPHVSTYTPEHTHALSHTPKDVHRSSLFKLFLYHNKHQDTIYSDIEPQSRTQKGKSINHHICSEEGKSQ